MSVFDVGDLWSQYFYVRDTSGTLANAGAVTATLTFPDLTTAAATVGAPSPAGTYLVSYPTALLQPGRHTIYVQATGANACAMSDQFDVRASAAVAIISLADARKTLNFPDNYTADDEELRDYIDVASAMIERRYGAVIPRTVTETVSSVNGMWALSTTPIISITSITGKITGLTSYLTTDVNIRSYSGVLYSTGGYALQPGPYSIVYQAGRQGVVPPEYLQATRILLQHLWRTQRGSDVMGQASDENYNSTYEIWRQIQTLLGDRFMPGFA